VSDEAPRDSPAGRRLLDGALQFGLVVGGIALLCLIAGADVGRDFTEAAKIPIAAAAALLALVWTVSRAPLWRRLRKQALILLVLVAGANYARWGFSAATERLDAYDLLHYYVNAKYFDELGYLDLYPAMLVVDQQAGPRFAAPSSYLAQDDLGHQLQPIAHGLARGREVRERFTDARWEAFEHDVLYLQREVGCTLKSRRTGKCVRELDDNLWNQLLNDHGFNGTTAWTLLAQPLTWIPVEWIKLVGYVDVGLLAAAIGLVGWAYGAPAALWTTLFLFVTYSTRWPYFSWAMLRYDWVAMLIATPALLALRWPVLGGFLAGTASLLRLFPALYLWGPLCKGLLNLRRPAVRRPLLLLAGGFVLALVVVQGAATLRFGVDSVRVHIANMRDHNRAEQLSSRRIGLALALATEPWSGVWTERRPRPPDEPRLEAIIDQERKERIEAQRPLRYGLALALMGLLGLSLRRRGDDEAYAFGFLPFFWLTTASYYYYVARVPLIVVHAGHLEVRRNQVLLAVLFAIEASSNAITSIHSGHRLFLIGNLAWDLTLYSVLAIAWMWLDDRQAPAPGAEQDRAA
jgi:hypothetical protein